MIIKEIKATREFNGDISATFRLDGDTRSLIEPFLKKSEEELSKYELNISKVRKKRSLDANAYAWVLIGKLARKLGTTPEEVYMGYILNTSAYEILPIRKDAFESWKRKWELKGTGWICEEIGDSKLKGYVNTKNYFGSSVYDTDEMSHLIDLIVADCREQGIETMTPDEILELKSKWGW